MAKKQTKDVKQVKFGNQSMIGFSNSLGGCCKNIDYENFFRDYFKPRCK